MGWQPHKWACDHRPARRKHVSGKLLSDEKFRMSCFMIYPPVIQDNNGTFTMNLDYFRKGKPWILFFLLENTGGYSRHNFQVSNIYIYIDIYIYILIYIYTVQYVFSNVPSTTIKVLISVGWIPVQLRWIIPRSSVLASENSQALAGAQAQACGQGDLAFGKLT